MKDAWCLGWMTCSFGSADTQTYKQWITWVIWTIRLLQILAHFFLGVGTGAQCKWGCSLAAHITACGQCSSVAASLPATLRWSHPGPRGAEHRLKSPLRKWQKAKAKSMKGTPLLTESGVTALPTKGAVESLRNAGYHSLPFTLLKGWEWGKI